ncbi:MAG TPA: YcxB family protein [Vicinamibacterales bacterium]
MGVPFGLVLFVGLKVLDVSFHMPTALLAAGLFILYYGVVRRQLAGVSSPAPEGALLGQRQTSIGEDGVREESRDHKSHSAWRGILSVGETPSHVFLMVDRFAGYIVPKRAFENPAQLADFLAFARRRADGARGQAPTDRRE